MRAVFFQKILEDPVVEAEIGQKPFELSILHLEGLQLPGIVDIQVPVLVAPAIEVYSLMP
jgi:hypothetical protein